MTRKSLQWGLLIAANVLFCGLLSFYSASQAAPTPGRQPFGNSVEQRGEMIRQLQEIKTLLQEQNRLLHAQADGAVDQAAQPRR